MDWDNVVIAVVMALPPIVAQLIAGRKDEVTRKATEAHSAAEEWRSLYENCQKRYEELEKDNDALRTELADADAMINKLRRNAPTRPIK